MSPLFHDLWSRFALHTSYRLAFSTDAVVTEAVRRINAMPVLEPVKFRIAKDVVEMGLAGLSSADARDRGEVVAESVRTIPDVVGALVRRLPLSRATVVRILRACDRLEFVRINPAVFIDQVADSINQALYDQLADEIVYTPTGGSWSVDLFRKLHQDETVGRTVEVRHSVTDRVIYDSEVERRFAEFLDDRDDVPLVIKLPDWFKIPTPLGNYNPDWLWSGKSRTATTCIWWRETKAAARTS